MSFKEVTGRYDGPVIENQVLEFWRDQDVFEKTLQMSSGRPLFTFNEGPPTANGRLRPVKPVVLVPLSSGD